MGSNATATEIGQDVESAVQEVDNAVGFGGKGGSTQTSQTKQSEEQTQESGWGKGGSAKQQEQKLAPTPQEPSQEEKYRAWEEKARTQLREQMARDRREYYFNGADQTKELLG